MSAVSVSYAFDLTKTQLHIKCAQSTDQASQIFWGWLLKHVRLTPKNAALHDVFEQDAAAVFFDLDDDNTDEIIGTHYASAASGRGNCLLYILKKNKNKYKKISTDIYFDPSTQVYALRQKTDGYRNIEVYTINNDNAVVYVFSKEKGAYIKKPAKK